MKYRRLGRTGLGVSPIALGTMGFGPPTTQRQVDSLVHSAIEMGINLIDTANCYDGPNRGDIVLGTSEAMIGNCLGSHRDEVVLLTKAGVPLRPGPQNRGLSSSHLMRELEASLRRLNTDFVDIFMIHWPDPFSNLEEVLRAVETLVKAGKTRYFGISNHLGWQVCEYLWEADKRNWPKVGASEIPLSILERRYENDLSFYDRHEVGVVCYQPLKAGLLSGRHRQPKQNSITRQEDSIAGWEVSFTDDLSTQLDQLQELASASGVTLAQFSLAWVLSQPSVTSAIVGVRTSDELQAALKAADLTLSPEQLISVDQIASGPEKPIPRFER
jgi:L-glyceraldehyde 3-phosphate reductase